MTATTVPLAGTAARRPAARSGAAQLNSPLRLTRRGRLLLIGAPVVLVVAALVFLAAALTAPAKAETTAGALTETVSVNVAPGETLWSLAAEFAPERDPRDVVSDIVELNNLGSSVVQAGQAVAVPVAR